MKLYYLYPIVILSLIHCSKQEIPKHCDYTTYRYNKPKLSTSLQNKSELYQKDIYISSVHYGIDAKLIQAIIEVESNYNPTAISKSNAIGLMQLKASSAGRDVHKLKGFQGEPSIEILKNASINIDYGTAYLFILQNKLLGITNLKTRRYAMIVAYVNGLNTLLDIFSKNHDDAIKKINKLTPEKFYQYIQKYHPKYQAQLYLDKVNSTYLLIQ